MRKKKILFQVLNLILLNNSKSPEHTVGDHDLILCERGFGWWKELMNVESKEQLFFLWCVWM